MFQTICILLKYILPEIEKEISYERPESAFEFVTYEKSCQNGLFVPDIRKGESAKANEQHLFKFF